MRTKIRHPIGFGCGSGGGRITGFAASDRRDFPLLQVYITEAFGEIEQAGSGRFFLTFPYITVIFGVYFSLIPSLVVLESVPASFLRSPAPFLDHLQLSP